MISKKFAAAAGIALSVAGAATTVSAEPASAPPLTVDIAPGVEYTAYKDGHAAVISVADGTLIVENGQFQIRDRSGRVLAGVPLEFTIDDIAFPIDTTIDGNTARLTPSLDTARAHYKPVALPFEEQAPWKSAYDREVAAWSRMTSTVSLGAGIGAIVGAVAAGTLGCLLGGAAGTVLTGPLATLFGAGPMAGCLIGVAALAPIGVLVGAIFVAAPVAIAAFIQYSATVNAPFTPVK
ncbi:hypothetical protein ACQP1G_30720 [Nocardia sp. CA-107356]|uniref:hypothetical protein n=1 Tax=Nocardia sp. CA-107356 TaxID=3239972 RepID=UPI003D8C3627